MAAGGSGSSNSGGDVLQPRCKLLDRVARYRIRESEAIVAKQVVPQLRHSRVRGRWFVDDSSDRTDDRQNLSSLKNPVDL